MDTTTWLLIFFALCIVLSYIGFALFICLLTHGNRYPPEQPIRRVERPVWLPEPKERAK